MQIYYPVIGSPFVGHNIEITKFSQYYLSNVRNMQAQVMLRVTYS